jgi:hypothetical protein
MKLFRDIPLFEDGADDRGDALGFSAYVTTMTEAIRGTDGPFFIGIVGEWGSGKTSLMRMICNRLNEDHKDEALTVWFNAWQYEGESHPIVPLVRCIAKAAAGASKGEPTTFANALGTLSRALRAILRGVSMKVEGGPPLIGKLSLEVDAGKAIEAEEKLKKQEEQGSLVYESIFAAVYAALDDAKLPGGKRIVIFLDDVDRCLPAKALQLLESLKVVFAQKGYIFVLGVSGTVLEGFLNYQYRSQYGIPDFEGRTYLDKVIQMQFLIPPHDARMQEFTQRLIERNPVLRDLDNIVRLAGRANPRAAIRFVNSLIVDDDINSYLAKTSKEQPVELLYFAMTRAIQTRWRSIYDRLLAAPDLCERVAEWTKNDVASKTTDAAHQWDQEVARAMQAYDDLAQLLLSSQGKKWLTDRGMREAAGTFLIKLARVSARQATDSEKLFDAFFSYPTTDKQLVGRVAEALKKVNIHAAWDADLKPGTNWKQALENSLRKSRALLYFFGSSTPGSLWQKREGEIGLEMAARDSSFKIVPILLPDSDDKLLKDELREWYWIDLRGTKPNEDDATFTDRLRDLILVIGSRAKANA